MGQAPASISRPAQADRGRNASSGLKVDAYASLPHFAAHILPIWNALPADVRGTFFAKGRGANYLAARGVEHLSRHPYPRHSKLCIVAAFEDYRAVKDTDIIFVNHGIGQTYSTDDGIGHSSYSGGSGRDRVKLFLCPSQRDADICGPNSVAVGIPYLDHLHPPKKRRVRNDPPVVAVSFHADVHVVPETRWALPYYKDEITRLAKEGTFNLLGHGHPRMHNYMEKFWRRLRVPFEPDWLKVIEQADLYVCDNSSTLYEFASLDKPVVVLNAPWYRREVEHGLRFWRYIPGTQVDIPMDLEEAIDFALEDPDPWPAIRSDVVGYAYSGLTDGKASKRAADAIMALVSTHG